MVKQSSDVALVQDFAAALEGHIILPDDQDYNAARKIWSGIYDRHPRLIVQCKNATDVACAVRFAHEQDLLVSVRGGGFNVAGTAVADDGLMIDLSLMNAVTVDPVKRTATAQAGIKLGAFVQATAAYGLATTTGVASDVGLSGLTLGGGMGWLMGKYGLTIDNLLSAEIVTADGEQLVVNSEHHPDLFWAIRGGGGNFGIATSFELKLYPLQEVLGGRIVYPLHQAKEVLRFYRDFSHTAPDELTIYATLVNMPNEIPVIALVMAYAGDSAEGLRIIQPLRAFGTPLLDQIGSMPYVQLAQMFDGHIRANQQNYAKGSSVKELNDEQIAVIVDQFAHSIAFSQVLLQHVHGAATRVDATATAFAHRYEHYSLVIISAWHGAERDAHIQWADSFCAALQPTAEAGIYVNMLSEDDDRLYASYGCNYQRLAGVKNAYDPKNFFRLNQNIKPTL